MESGSYQSVKQRRTRSNVGVSSTLAFFALLMMSETLFLNFVFRRALSCESIASRETKRSDWSELERTREQSRILRLP
jgi:hypothetical protein